MCGILGAVNFHRPLPFSGEEFSQKLDALKHRGPDDGGVFEHAFAQGQVLLGHRRLAIIDLDPRSRGPLLDQAQQVAVTFNGEIYNYRELRQELIELGHRFITESDTEVIVEAYKEWGQESFSRLAGMFAFALVDLAHKRFFLVRDRLGIKPVYYSYHQGTFYFSSELKGLLSFGLPKILDHAAVSSFLSYRYVLGEKTYFKNMFTLLPGELLQLKEDGPHKKKYWDLDLSERPGVAHHEQRAELKRLLENSVREHTMSDVPLGSFLSGGLDSTLILREMSKFSQNIETFTVKFNEQGYDETHYAQMAARAYGAKNTELLVQSEDYLQKVRELIAFKDQPLGMHNEVALYLMSAKLKKYVTVVLSGEGSDELFSGYGQLFRSPFDYSRLRFVGKLPRSLQTSGARAMGLNEKQIGLSRLEHFLSQYSYFPQAEKYQLFTPQMKKEVGHDEYTQKLFADSFAQSAHRPYYDQINHAFVKHHLPGLLLMMDATSMAASVEVRVPFLDHRVVEASFRLPYWEKLKWKSPLHFLQGLSMPAKKLSEAKDITKFVLKDLYRQEIPRPILERQKMVFPVPLKEWFTEQMPNLVEKELLGSQSRVAEIFDQKKLKTWMTEKNKKADALYGRQLWLMLNLEYWMQAYL